MTSLMVSFCNVFPPGLALGIYDFDADRFKWVELSSIGENWVGVDGICRQADGYWILAQAAWGGVSALAFVNRELKLSCSYRLVQAGDAHSLIAYRDGFLITDTQHDRLVFAQIVDDGRAVAQRNHIGFAIRAFLRLECHRLATAVSWFEAKASIVREAMRAYLAHPHYILPSTA